MKLSDATAARLNNHFRLLIEDTSEARLHRRAFDALSDICQALLEMNTEGHDAHVRPAWVAAQRGGADWRDRGDVGGLADRASMPRFQPGYVPNAPEPIRNWTHRISQFEYLAWALSVFPAAQVLDKRERAMRFLEEAMELAQTQGITLADMDRLAGRVMSRPVGVVEQEIGGAMFTLYSLADNLTIDANDCAEKDLLRVRAMDPEFFRTKNAEKIRDGVAFVPQQTLKEHP